MLSPLASPNASPRPAEESTTGDSKSIHSSSQLALSKTSQGTLTPTELPNSSSSNPAANGSDSNQNLTTMDLVSESSTTAAGSGIPDTLQSMVTRNDESNELKEKMDLDEPHQAGSSHPEKNAISNTESKKLESGNDESHQAGTSPSTNRPRRKARSFDGDVDKKNIIRDTGVSCGTKLTRSKKRSVEKKIETTSDNVNESHTAQSPNTEAVEAAASQNDTRITSGGQRKAANLEHLAGLPLHRKGSTLRNRTKNTSTDKTTIEKAPSENHPKMMEATEVQSPTNAQQIDHSYKYEPEKDNSCHLHTLIRAKPRYGKEFFRFTKKQNLGNSKWHFEKKVRDIEWRFKVTKKQKRRVPVGDAQYIWLQRQPKSVRDKATEMDREGTSYPLGTFWETTKGTLYDGKKFEDRVSVQFMSQFIKDRHTPIPADERKRMKMKETFTFKTYFPDSALVQCCPTLRYHSSELNVEFIETVLETKSKESLELKDKIIEAIKIQTKKNAEAAEAAKAAKVADAAVRAADAVANGLIVAPVAPSLACSKEFLRVGLECEMILDDQLPEE